MDTFGSFITAPANELALGAAKAIVGEPGTKYNPFFLYGERYSQTCGAGSCTRIKRFRLRLRKILNYKNSSRNRAAVFV
jgi:hypothetical protein